MNVQDRRVQAVQVGALALLFAAFPLLEAVQCRSLSSLTNSDIWWHLSTGLWMLQHHALPHTGIFSQAAERPWIAASWLFDLKLAIYYRLLGLRAIPMCAMFFKAGLGVVTFLLAGGRRGNFWGAVAISVIAQYVLGGLPATALYGSVIFLGVELLLLLESRQHAQMLWWLAPLFLVWANVDVNFVYGLGALVLFVFAEVVSAALQSASTGAGFTAALTRSATQKKRAFLAGALCFVATLFTPYFYRPYQVFFATAWNGANAYLPDHKALGFRQPQDYVLLLFVMAAFLALGLRRSRNLFLIAALAAGAGLSFYSQHDAWLVTLAAVAVMGETLAGAVHPAEARDAETRDEAETRDKKDASAKYPAGGRTIWIAAALTAVALVAAAAALVPRSGRLMTKVAESYPVAAADSIRSHRMAQPIFNAFEWGGFLTWYLPEFPVAIDGRVDLYGDDFIIEYSKVMNADVRYTEFPALAGAQTIVLPRTAIMAQAMATVSGYKVAYQDDVAVVISRE
jgi:hypothetical protein